MTSRSYTGLDALQGGTEPRAVAAGAVLGLWLGCTAGPHWLCAALLVCVVATNVSTLAVLIAAVASGFLALVFASGTEQIGRWLMTATPLAAPINLWSEGPLGALLGLTVPTCLGGAAAALAASWPVWRMTGQLFETQIAPPSTGLSAVQPVTPRPRYTRPVGWMLGPVAVVLAVVLPWYWQTQQAQGRLLAELSHFNRAEVTARTVEIDLWRGDFTLTEVHLADPLRPDRNRWQLDRVTGQLNTGALLAGRIEAGRIDVIGVACDVARSSLAKNISSPTEAALPAVEPHEATSRAEAFDLSPWLRGADHWSRQLTQLGHWMGAPEALAACDANLPQRASAVAAPRLHIARLAIEPLADVWGLGARARCEITALSSRREPGQPGCLIQIQAPEYGAELQAKQEADAGATKFAVHLSAAQLPVEDLVDEQRVGQEGRPLDGTLSLVGSGTADARQLELRLDVEWVATTGGRARVEPIVRRGAATDWAGIERSVWTQGLHRLGQLTVPVTVCGRWSNPRVDVIPAMVAEQFRYALRAAGETELLAASERPVTPRIASPATQLDALAALAERTTPPPPVVEPTPPADLATTNPVASYPAAAVTPVPSRYPETSVASQPQADRYANEQVATPALPMAPAPRSDASSTTDELTPPLPNVTVPSTSVASADRPTSATAEQRAAPGESLPESVMNTGLNAADFAPRRYPARQVSDQQSDSRPAAAQSSYNAAELPAWANPSSTTPRYGTAATGNAAVGAAPAAPTTGASTRSAPAASWSSPSALPAIATDNTVGSSTLPRATNTAYEPAATPPTTYPLPSPNAQLPNTQLPNAPLTSNQSPGARQPTATSGPALGPPTGLERSFGGAATGVNPPRSSATAGATINNNPALVGPPPAWASPPGSVPPKATSSAVGQGTYVNIAPGAGTPASDDQRFGPAPVKKESGYQRMLRGVKEKFVKPKPTSPVPPDFNPAPPPSAPPATNPWAAGPVVNDAPVPTKKKSSNPFSLGNLRSPFERRDPNLDDPPPTKFSELPQD